jgi:hypothetical protein
MGIPDSDFTFEAVNAADLSGKIAELSKGPLLDYMQRFIDAKVFLLDDLFTANMTPTFKRHLFSLIEARYARGLQTIVTHERRASEVVKGLRPGNEMLRIIRRLTGIGEAGALVDPRKCLFVNFNLTSHEGAAETLDSPVAPSSLVPGASEQ